MRVLELINN